MRRRPQLFNCHRADGVLDVFADMFGRPQEMADDRVAVGMIPVGGGKERERRHAV